MSRFRDKDAGGVCKPLLITVDPKSQPELQARVPKFPAGTSALMADHAWDIMGHRSSMCALDRREYFRSDTTTTH